MTANGLRQGQARGGQGWLGGRVGARSTSPREHCPQDCTTGHDNAGRLGHTGRPVCPPLHGAPHADHPRPPPHRPPRRVRRRRHQHRDRSLVLTMQCDTFGGARAIEITARVPAEITSPAIAAPTSGPTLIAGATSIRLSAASSGIHEDDPRGLVVPYSGGSRRAICPTVEPTGSSGGTKPITAGCCATDSRCTIR